MPWSLRHCLLASLFVVLVSSDFLIKDGTVPSYLESKFDTVDEDIFPKNIFMRLSLTKIAGTLLCSIDAHGNQLIMRLSSKDSPSLLVEFRRKETELLLNDFCGCTTCTYTNLSITVNITTELRLQCNGLSPKTIAFDGTISLNPDFPAQKPEMNNGKNSAILWLINTPKIGQAYHNPEQLQACIFSFKYNSVEPYWRTVGSIIKQCPQTCTPNACHGGVCYEAYMDQPVCDCSHTFGSGPTCLDESRVINKRFNFFAIFSSIKLSWKSNEMNIFEIGSAKTTLNLTIENAAIYLHQNYGVGQAIAKDRLTNQYNKRSENVLIMNFGKPTTVQVMSDTTTISNGDVDLSKEVFEYIRFSSGSGVVDMVVKTENSAVSWKRLLIFPDPDPVVTSTTAPSTGDEKMWILLVLIIPVFLIVFMPIWLKRKKIWKKRYSQMPINDKELKPLLFSNQSTPPSNTTIIPRAGKVKVLHFEKFSVAFCEEDENFRKVLEEFNKFVVPLNNPVLVCQLESNLGFSSPSMRMMQLCCDELVSDEYLICDDNRDVESMIKDLRNWIICDSENNKKQRDKVHLQMKQPLSPQDWTKYHQVVFDGMGRPFMAISLFLNGDKSIEETREVIGKSINDFLKGVIWSSMYRPDFDKDNILTWTKKLMLVRPSSFNFTDSLGNRLPEKQRIADVDNIKIGFPLPIEKYLDKMIFVPQLDGSDTWKAAVENLLSQESMLLQCITDGRNFCILSSKFQTANQINDEVQSYFAAGTDVLFISNDRILSTYENIISNQGFLQYVAIFQHNSDVHKLQTEGVKSETIDLCTISGKSEIYAVKKMKIQTKDAKELYKSICNEIMVTAKLEVHERIVRYHHFYKDSTNLYIFMDLMKESLKSYISSNPSIEEETIIGFSRQILEGLKYLHSKKTLHRNLKSSNILLDQNNEIKLTGFGESKCVQDKESQFTHKSGKTVVGTINYMAPEVISGQDYGSAADVWSFGMVMVEMVTGKPPYSHLTQPAIVLHICRKPTVEYEIPSNFKNVKLKTFIDSCLIKEQTNRPRCTDLLADDIFHVNSN